MWLSRIIAAVVFTAVLSSCGFQVRGTTRFPEDMSVVYIDTSDRYSAFYRHLTTTFEHAGLSLTDDVTRADTQFRILRDETGQRVLSVNARNEPVEYEVFYTVNYSVNMSNKEILTPQQLTQTRNYTYDITQVLGKAVEEEILRESLSKDLVNLVTRRMSSI